MQRGMAVRSPARISSRWRITVLGSIPASVTARGVFDKTAIADAPLVVKIIMKVVTEELIRIKTQNHGHRVR
jgi:hypothetical protein